LRLILFDIDGTLVLTGGAGLEALRRVFREAYDIANGVDNVPFHGLTDPVIFQAIARKRLDRELEGPELERMRESYLDQLDGILERGETEFRLLPGAREVVEELSVCEDVVLGLATGNFERAAIAKLKRAGLASYFDFGGYGSDSHDRIELTRIAQERGRERAGRDAPVIVVGDTVYDVRSALAVGASCLAVATGNASVESLRAEGAHWAVSGLTDPSVRGILGLPGPGGGSIDPPGSRC
jgi:phosphoglycolate phosphatase-like HAD superfamily hydrolase